MPTVADNFNLTPQEFCDALAIRYKKPLLFITPCCDDCGTPSRLEHFLSCKRGGLIIQRHNKFQDAIADLATFQWSQVRHELIASGDATSTNAEDVLVVDIDI